jgi:hypothetical protein
MSRNAKCATCRLTFFPITTPDYLPQTHSETWRLFDLTAFIHSEIGVSTAPALLCLLGIILKADSNAVMRCAILLTLPHLDRTTLLSNYHY